jgi:hypothetical protein
MSISKWEFYFFCKRNYFLLLKKKKKATFGFRRGCFKKELRRLTFGALSFWRQNMKNQKLIPKFHLLEVLFKTD